LLVFKEIKNKGLEGQELVKMCRKLLLKFLVTFQDDKQFLHLLGNAPAKVFQSGAGYGAGILSLGCQKQFLVFILCFI
jgi:hypothetical protein